MHFPVIRLKAKDTFKCVCGKDIFIGKPDSNKRRHGFCSCGLAWHLGNRTYAQPMEAK